LESEQQLLENFQLFFTSFMHSNAQLSQL